LERHWFPLVLHEQKVTRSSSLNIKVTNIPKFMLIISDSWHRIFLFFLKLHIEPSSGAWDESSIHCLLFNLHHSVSPFTLYSNPFFNDLVTSPIVRISLIWAWTWPLIKILLWKPFESWMEGSNIRLPTFLDKGLLMVAFLIDFVVSWTRKSITREQHIFPLREKWCCVYLSLLSSVHLFIGYGVLHRLIL